MAHIVAVVHLRLAMVFKRQLYSYSQISHKCLKRLTSTVVLTTITKALKKWQKP